MKLILYILRWQLSTPILAIIVYYLNDRLGSLITTVIANFIGALIFYSLDKKILNS